MVFAQPISQVIPEMAKEIFSFFTAVLQLVKKQHTIIIENIIF
ncbi:hypothetical protein PHEL49_0085 [Polaribacter sp. Hel1_33_49]|nr:hypothetical protein PHEL49_0085 [Polaribacter sp. Hel1_33_49]